MPKKMRNKDLELVTRNYPVNLRASNDESGSIIEGTPIVFNQDTRMRDWAGEYIERIDPHALDEADLSDVLFCVNHDISKIPLARSKNGKGTMTFNIDSEGLHIKSVLDTENNQEARSLYSAVQRGDISGMSFMFRIKSQEWSDLDTDLPTRTINEISIVHELGPVNFPAYPQTSVSARSKSEETDYSPLEEAKRAYVEETTQRDKNLLELEKAKNLNRMK